MRNLIPELCKRENRIALRPVHMDFLALHSRLLPQLLQQLKRLICDLCRLYNLPQHPDVEMLDQPLPAGPINPERKVDMATQYKQCKVLTSKRQPSQSRHAFCPHNRSGLRMR